MSWDKHYQTSFPSKNYHFRSIKHEISAVVHLDVTLWTNKQHQTNLLKSCDRWNPMQLYTAGFSLNWTCKLAVTHSILTCSSLYNLQHFPLLFVIIFLTILQQQAMAPETLPPGAIGPESIRTTGASRNAPLGETQQQRRHQLVHRDAAIIATENMTQDAHLERYLKPEAARRRSSMHSDVSQSISV